MIYYIKLALFSSKHFHECHYFRENMIKTWKRKKCNISGTKAEEISTSFKKKKMFRRRHKYAKFRRRHMNAGMDDLRIYDKRLRSFINFSIQNARKMR